jgi:hypothetical protein
MEGGNATDGAGRTDETGQGEPMRERSPSPPDKTARSDKDNNLPFGLGKGYVELAEVARPEQQLPVEVEATKVARPEQKAPAEAAQSQDTFDSDSGGPEQPSPATIVMSPGDQAQVARWKEEDRMGKIVPNGHDPEIAQRRMESSARQDFGTPPTQAAMPLFE